VAAPAGRPMNETVPTAASRKRRIALPGGRFNKTSEVAAAPEPAATAAPDSQGVKVRPQGADPHPLPFRGGMQVEIIRTGKLSPSSSLR
jgi:hypothetical protein